MIFRPAVFNLHILAVDISAYLQALHEGGHELRIPVRRTDVEEPNHRHRWLLRARCKRPRSRAAEKRNELASPHSITSSARARSIGGTVRPSAFAVLRLITSSNLVGCWTGSSPGLAPLRIRSA